MEAAMVGLKDPFEKIDYEKELNKINVIGYLAAVAVMAVIMSVIFVSCSAKPAHASEIVNVEKLATAIYYAENSKSHPYGIMVHYKHTSARTACINTIRHALRDWNGKGDFLAFLASRYAPIGASNDPRGLNRNWVKNVRYFYGNS